MKNIKKLLPLIITVILLIATVLVGILVLKINPVVVCALVVLEAVLAALLGKIQLWIHGLIFIGQLTVGFIAKNPVFMACLLAVYVSAVVSVYFKDNK